MNDAQQADITRFSYMRFAVSTLLFVLWAIVMPILFFLSHLIPGFEPQSIVRRFHWGVCLILGLKVEFRGEMSEYKPTLFVGNHVSYLDIFVLGQKIPGFFVAKSEVASWPVLNKFARLQNTLFIERRASAARKQLDELRGHLVNGTNLILFPEGTSTNGVEVKPFKSSLFAAADAEQTTIKIQPFSVLYTSYDNQAMNQATRDNFAWYDDMPFGSHLVKVLGLRPVSVVVEFHPVVELSEFADRKACADQCQAAVDQAMQRELDLGNIVSAAA